MPTISTYILPKWSGVMRVYLLVKLNSYVYGNDEYVERNNVLAFKINSFCVIV